MTISIGNQMPNLMPVSLGKIFLHRGLKINPKARYFVLTKKENQYRTNLEIFDDKMNNCFSIKDLGIRSGLLKK